MLTNQTTNYELHVWEPEDSFLRSEINENFAILDTAIANGLDTLSAGKAEQSDLNILQTAMAEKAEVIFGSYTGGLAAGATVNLGFTPRMVLVADESKVAMGPAVTGGYSTSGYLYVTQNGFHVTTGTVMNNSGAHYYMAIK